MTDTKRVKICFWLQDMDSKGRVQDDQGTDTWQVVMEFKGADYDKMVEEARAKFLDLPEEDFARLVAPMHIGWSDEIIRAGFLTVAKYTQGLVLKHLELSSAEELLKRWREQRVKVA